MRQQSDPLRYNYPNWGNTIDENLPLVCTLLFGFSGTFFTSIALSDPSATKNFQLSLAFLDVNFAVKQAIMLLTGASSLLFVVSVIVVVRSRMFDVSETRKELEKIDRDDETKKVDNVAIHEFMCSQDRLRRISVITFNSGLYIIPFSGMLFLPEVMFCISSLLYILILITLKYLDRIYDFV
jgi:hypothetical protein